MYGRRAVWALFCAGGLAAVIAGCSSGSSEGAAPTAVATSAAIATSAGVTTSAPGVSPSSSPSTAAAVTAVINRSGRDEAGFTTPSGHIACMFNAQEDRFLICEINQKSWRSPPKPARCQNMAWAYGIQLDAGATARPHFYCGTDTIRGDHRAGTDGSVVLPYGSAMRLAPFTCTSEATGVTCLNTTTKARFFLSRERYQFRNP